MTLGASTTAAESHCPACASVLNGSHDRCPNCDRLLGEATARRLRRLMSFIFGLLMQIMVALLVWYFPPGVSAGSWAAYLGLSVVGFLQIIWGASGWRDLKTATESLAVTARFDPDDIPFHAKACAACGHSLARAIEAATRTCPSCGTHFSRRDLGWTGHDPHGEPARLPGAESRARGPLVVITVVVVFGVILLGFWAGLSSVPRNPPPSPAAPSVTP